jgi:shikimate dehydrogenase
MHAGVRLAASHKWACLLGHPVAHSLSPALHNAAFVALGIDAHYEARDVAPADVGFAVAQLRHPDCLGANVTAPHKQAVRTFVDEVSDEVVALGAINTIVNQAGRLVAANTDAGGLERWMRESAIDPSGGTGSALVIGAGGAARATVWALAELGARSILVVNRTLDRAEQLVVSLRPHLRRPVELTCGPLDQVASSAATPTRVIVNATSLGHHGSAPVVHPSWYSPDSAAIELAYNPPQTGFMLAAQVAGARAENGLGMLLHQAALAFERWTGQAPPIDVLAAALEQGVAR